jgi:Sec-independent protein translocase protein TatA
MGHYAWFHWFLLALVIVILIGSGRGKPGGGSHA